MNNTPSIELADISVSASINYVRAEPRTQKAVDAGFQASRIREEYSDQLREMVTDFAKLHNLTVDWKGDW